MRNCADAENEIANLSDQTEFENEIVQNCANSENEIATVSDQIGFHFVGGIILSVSARAFARPLHVEVTCCCLLFHLSANCFGIYINIHTHVVLICWHNGPARLVSAFFGSSLNVWMNEWMDRSIDH